MKIKPHKIAIYFSPKSHQVLLYNETTMMCESELMVFRTSKYMLNVFNQCYEFVGFL